MSLSHKPPEPWRKNDTAPPAAGLRAKEVENEVEIIRRARTRNDVNGYGC
jgi:hypothetical protein